MGPLRCARRLSGARTLVDAHDAADGATDHTGDRGLARVPLGRWGTPDEIAKLVVFLAADGGYVIG